ncbi:protein of unknown function [Thermomonospora echinospora]|uniref:DUF1707 domain-containing protein n=1 Tax=Thermomonospora echinospora TaxID=1992 RepID=A0A1H5XGK6_9ACTN|nr:DUF1707 domain-containing protein [Thermomonospora echinospora]SEG10326.1 protein of unknown function [Thermomonospora echinospora]
MDLRIGDAERDAVAEALHEHFAKGRLTRAELDERLGSTLTAKTEGDLREVVADLPGPSGLAQPSGRGRPHPMAWHGPGHPVHRHRHGPPPLVPLLFLLFLIGTFTAGPVAGAFLALKVMVVFWVAAGLFAVARLHRLHRLHR